MVSRELNLTDPDRCKCMNLCTNIQYEFDINQQIMVDSLETEGAVSAEL